MNHPIRSINDSHPATSSATSKDIYATWTPSATKSGFEPSRHHRSASGYPVAPDYTSSSRRHAERPSSSRARNVSESQPLSVPSQIRYREPPYTDTAHSHPHRNPDLVPHAPSSRRHAHVDPGHSRQNYSAVDAVQYPHVNYERWIPPNQPSPPTHQQEHRHRERDRYEREKEKEKQRQREEYYRDRRDENDLREKHKRRYDEGDSDWDKERRERREKERYREPERDRVKDQERERIKEDYPAERARERIAKEKTRGADGYRDERDQETYAEKERQRVMEKERERERRRQKEREREQDQERERKHREKYDDQRERKDHEREGRRDKELARPEREHWREVEKGRESDREPDKRRRRGNEEQEKEREREKESTNRGDGRADVPFNEGRRHETEHERTRKTQEAARRFPTADVVEGGSMPFVIRDQEAERMRRDKRDNNSPRQKEYEKVQRAGEQSETERVRYTDKESVSRREHKPHEKIRRSGGSRPHADRVTDSERENPSYRDITPSNPHLREPTLRPVEPEVIVVASKLPAVLPKHPKDERDLHSIPLENSGGVTRTTVLESMTTSVFTKAFVPGDGPIVPTMPMSQPIDQTLSMTPKDSPVSAAGAESLKLDPGAPDTKSRQGQSSQRALRRQSKLSNSIPEQIAVFPPLHAANKHAQTRNDMPQPPSSHAFKTEKEDSARLYQGQVPIDSVQHYNPIPSMNPAVATKLETKTNIPSVTMHRTTSSSLNNTSNRSVARNSNIFVQPPSSYDKPNPDLSQPTYSHPKHMQGGGSTLEVQLPPERPSNDGDGKPRTNVFPNPSAEYIVARPASRNQLDKMGKHSGNGLDTLAPTPILPLTAPPVAASLSSTSARPNSRSSTKAPNMLPTITSEPETKVVVDRSRAVPQPVPSGTSFLVVQQEIFKREKTMVIDKVQNVNENPLRRPPSTMGWLNQQEASKDRTAATPMGSYTNATELVPQPFQRSSSADSQFTNNGQLASPFRRPTTGFYSHKQEGLLSRVHTKTPIPEEVAVSVPNRPTSTAPIDSSFQYSATTSHRRSPPEHSVAPRMNIRSASETVGVTSIPMIKTATMSASKTLSVESAQNRKGAELSRMPNAINPENVLPVPTSQHEDKSGHTTKSTLQEDQLRSESLQSHSPATSLRRDTSIQPSSNKPPNAVDRIDISQPTPPRSQLPGSRSHALAPKASEEMIVIVPNPRPSRANEDTSAHTIQGAFGRSAGRTEANLSSPKDPQTSVMVKRNNVSNVVQNPEQGPTNTIVRSIPANDIALSAPMNSTVPSIPHDSSHKNIRHPQHRPSKTSEDANVQGVFGRSTGQIEFDSSSPKDPQTSGKAVMNIAPNVVQNLEQGTTNITVQEISANDKTLTASVNSTISGLPHESSSKNIRHPQHRLPRTSEDTSVQGASGRGTGQIEANSSSPKDPQTSGKVATNNTLNIVQNSEQGAANTIVRGNLANDIALSAPSSSIVPSIPHDSGPKIVRHPQYRPPRTSEDSSSHAIQGRSTGQAEINLKDSQPLGKNNVPNIVQNPEQGPANTIVRGNLVNDMAPSAPLSSIVPNISYDSGPKNARHPQHRPQKTSEDSSAHAIQGRSTGQAEVNLKDLQTLGKVVMYNVPNVALQNPEQGPANTIVRGNLANDALFAPMNSIVPSIPDSGPKNVRHLQHQPPKTSEDSSAHAIQGRSTGQAEVNLKNLQMLGKVVMNNVSNVVQNPEQGPMNAIVRGNLANDMALSAPMSSILPSILHDSGPKNVRHPQHRPPKTSDDTSVQGVPGRSTGQVEINLSSPKDSQTSGKAIVNNVPNVQNSEQGSTNTTVRGISAYDRVSIPYDSSPKNPRHPLQADYRHFPKTLPPSVINNTTHEGSVPRKQPIDVIMDKKPEFHARSHQPPSGPKEEQTPNNNDASINQPQDDKKVVILHEGLARVLEQSLDRQTRKIRASPSSQSSQSILLQEELNETDRRQPSHGTPKTISRSSPSMVPYKTPSPTVKTLNHGTSVNKSHVDQENHSPKNVNQPNESPSRYPHSIYRPSSLYPSVNTSVSYNLTESSKNQAQTSHNYTNPPLEAGQAKNPPSYQTNPSVPHSSSRYARDVMPTTYNQRPSMDALESGDLLSRHHLSYSNQTKGQESNSHKSQHTDVARSHQPRLPDLRSSPRTLDVSSSRATPNDAGRTDPSSRTQESSPGIVPMTSLLFSKATDHTPHEPFEQKGVPDYPSTPTSYPSRGASNAYASSPASQDLEKHEPRLITPRVQKHAELPEEPHKKSNSLDVAKGKPLEEVHKKSPSLGVFHSKPYDQARPHEIWYPPATFRDDDHEGKARSKLIPAAEPVATKEVPVPVDNDRGTTIKRKPEQIKAGRKSPNITNMKVYRYLREKRNRTISAVSMEAQDGTAPSTVVGSPTASVISQAPPIHVPSPRDPMKAAQDWLAEGVEASMRAQAQGKRRILRPGVVFDVAEDPPRDERRHRSKLSRTRTQGKRT